MALRIFWAVVMSGLDLLAHLFCMSSKHLLLTLTSGVCVFSPTVVYATEMMPYFTPCVGFHNKLNVVRIASTCARASVLLSPWKLHERKELTRPLRLQRVEGGEECCTLLRSVWNFHNKSTHDSFVVPILINCAVVYVHWRFHVLTSHLFAE